jgi:hypothetical protein
MGENVVDQRQLRSGSEVVVGRLSPHAAFHDALLCDMLAFFSRRPSAQPKLPRLNTAKTLALRAFERLYPLWAVPVSVAHL